MGFPDEPGSREPGLDHLIKALTANGYPYELRGRDAALAAFRAASRQPRRRLRLSPGRGMPSRLSAVAAALVLAIAGVTAAAYARALPAPMQHIAYSVLAPLGVPNSQSPAAPTPSGAPSGPVPGSTAGGISGTASPSTSYPSLAPPPSRAIADSALVLTAARARPPAGDVDAISGKLTYHGRPEPGVQVRLLEKAAGAPGWQLVATGVTNDRGRVRFLAPYLTRNTTFQLVVPGGPSSAKVSVTVIPHVLLWLVPGTATDRLVASARFGDPGDTVVLQKESGGVWQDVATQSLGAAHQATFKVPVGTATGAAYRARLQATATHGAGVSRPVRQIPRRTGTGAKDITPATPRPLPSATSPSPTPTSPLTSPSPTSAPRSPTPTPSEDSPTLNPQAPHQT
jgi:hypothetical protein